MVAGDEQGITIRTEILSSDNLVSVRVAADDFCPLACLDPTILCVKVTDALTSEFSLIGCHRVPFLGV